MKAAPWRTAATVARRLSATARVGLVTVPGGRHAMLRHGGTFERYAAEFVTATLLGTEPRSPAVAAVLSGTFLVEG